jgi:hypothetical protein
MHARTRARAHTHTHTAALVEAMNQLPEAERPQVGECGSKERGTRALKKDMRGNLGGGMDKGEKNEC